MGQTEPELVELPAFLCISRLAGQFWCLGICKRVWNIVVVAKSTVDAFLRELGRVFRLWDCSLLMKISCDLRSAREPTWQIRARRMRRPFYSDGYGDGRRFTFPRIENEEE